MGRKLYWLSEEQLSQKIWDSNFFDLESVGNVKAKFKEFKIGNGFVDFAVFNDSVELFELKLTVTTHSIFQIIKYGFDMESQLLNTFYFNHRNQIDCKKSPKVKLHLVGRFIENECIEYCQALNITLWKSIICDKTGKLIDVELFSDCGFNAKTNDQNLDSLLLEHFNDSL